MKKVQYEFWLSSIPGIGCRKIKALLERFGAPEDIFRLKREQLQEISSHKRHRNADGIPEY